MHTNIITHEEKSDHDLQDQMSRSECKLTQITMSPKILVEQTVMMTCKVNGKGHIANCHSVSNTYIYIYIYIQ